MRFYLRRGVAGLVCALGMIAGTSFAQSLPTPNQSPDRYTVAECNVYPQTFHETHVDTKQPLPLDAWDASPQQLLADFPDSLIKVPVDDSINNFLYLSWLGGNGSSDQLNTAFSHQGALAQGFTEAPPLLTDTVAIAQMDSRLQIGDWVQAMPSSAVTSLPIINTLIANKTPLILPLHDVQSGHNGSVKYHISQVVAVRLVGFNLIGGHKFMLFALLDDQPAYTCFNFDDQTTVNTPISFLGLMPIDLRVSQVRWDFGDGTTSNALNPSHSYAQSGTYTVSLSIIPMGELPAEFSPPRFAAQGIVQVDPLSRWAIWIPTVQQD